jgi:diguanylate cyclase (GGDEF)-like protein/PAS domain S-box-containing protein
LVAQPDIPEPETCRIEASSLAAQDARRARWEVALVSAAMWLVVAAAILGLWNSARESAYTGFRNSLKSLALEAAATVDPQLHEQIRKPEQLNGPEYARAVAPLRRILQAVPDIRYIYTLVRSGDEIHFVLDASDPAALSANGKPDQSGVWELYPHRDRILLLALGDRSHPGIPITSAEPLSDEWGTFMSGFAPLKDAAGHQIGILGVDVDAHKFLARQAASRERGLLGLLPAGVLITILGILFHSVRRRGLAHARAAFDRAAEARRSAEVLAEERRRLADVIEGTDVGTWEWQASSRQIILNDRLVALLGPERSQLEPLTLARLRSRIQPDDYRSLKRAISECLANFDAVFVHELRLKRASGEWSWVLARGKVMQQDTRGRPTVIAGIVMDVSARKALETALIRSAQQDRLSGLPNRAVFMEHLEQALNRVRNRKQSGCAVLFFDFDRFKSVNDALGHEAGDELLRQIARRLQAELRLNDFAPADAESDVISRFGGDEFLVLLNRVHKANDAVRVAERLLNALAPGYDILGHELYSMASVGIATSDQGTRSAEEFVRNADIAMYEAKRAGGGCSVLFNEVMHARLTRHLTIETSLRRALAAQELHLQYQPIVDLESGARRGVGVSIRWNHPTLGLIPQSEFTPVAEKSGLLQAIGLWVIEQACADLARWRALDAARAPESVNIKLSGPEIALGDRLIAHIRTTLQSCGLPAAHLQFEVPEREFTRDPEAVGELLRKLRELGTQLGMDGFGAGHASMSVLRDCPLDTVRLDRSLLQDLHGSHGSLAVASALLNLVSNLGLVSVADGIEDSTQVAILQTLGCQRGQGSMFGKPMPAAEVLNLVPCLDAVSAGSL